MLKEIASYIEEKTSLKIGLSLFAGFVPSNTQSDIVILIESGGALNYDLTDQIEKTLQVLSRARDYWTARENALKIFNVLHGLSGVALPVLGSQGYYLNTSEAIAAPQSLGKNDAGQFNISTNYIIRLRNI